MMSMPKDMQKTEYDTLKALSDIQKLNPQDILSLKYTNVQGAKREQAVINAEKRIDGATQTPRPALDTATTKPTPLQ